MRRALNEMDSKRLTDMNEILTQYLEKKKMRKTEERFMMKSDVLDGFEKVKACVSYKVNGKETNEFPFEINDGVEPVYVEMPGWNVDMTKMKSEDEFPEEFNAYLSFLEEELGVPIKIVSVGPDREQTIIRYTED